MHGRTRCSVRCAATRNRWAACPTIAVRRPGRGTCRTRGRSRRNSRWTIGLRMYKWGQDLSQGGEASAFSLERFDPTWGGNPPVFFRPVLSAATRSRAESAHRRNSAGNLHRVDRAGHGIHLQPGDHGAEPVRDQRHRHAERRQLSRGRRRRVHRAAADSVRSARRHGVGAQSATVIRVAGGSFHDGTGGPTSSRARQRGVSLTQDDLLHRLRQLFDRRHGAPSPVPNTSGAMRTETKRPNNIRFTAAIQREIG